MEAIAVQKIIGGLTEAGVRYLVVDGPAVNAHGYVRFTADVDVILSLDAANVEAALRVFSELGYVPRAPVPLADFQSEQNRQEWRTKKRMIAFSLFSPQHSGTEIDLFIDDPLGFDRAYAARHDIPLGPQLLMPVCSLPDLRVLQRKADRPKDRIDLEQLAKLYPEPEL